MVVQASKMSPSSSRWNKETDLLTTNHLKLKFMEYLLAPCPNNAVGGKFPKDDELLISSIYVPPLGTTTNETYWPHLVEQHPSYNITDLHVQIIS